MAMNGSVHRRISELEKALQLVEAAHGLSESLPVEIAARGPGSRAFRPGRVSSRLVIGPPGVSLPVGEKGYLLFIEPQEAFGDGNHPTTRLALRLLDELLGGNYGGLLKGQRWVLDAGCGSGVLALAAASLADYKVLGVDLDPRAIAAARRNLRHNPGPASRTYLALGDLSCVQGPFFVTMANLVPPLHERVCDILWGAVEPGGWLILSGFCEAHKSAILGPYYRKGAFETAFLVDNAWAGCLLWKPLR
jgi:ribosomal protein L11 methyltransferase